MVIKLKMLLVNKSLVRVGESWVVKLDFAEEKPNPPMMFEGSGLVRDILPIIQQTIQAINPTAGFQLMPRMTLWLLDEEWESLDRKPEIGEEVTIIIGEKGDISLKL